MDASVTVGTRVEPAVALPYLIERVSVSCVVESLGVDVIEKECGVITVVTSPTAPTHYDFNSGWGGGGISACHDWLTGTVISYLRANPNGVVLFEDIVSSPTDRVIQDHAHPPYWCFEGRVFWPVVRTNAVFEGVRQAMSWAAARIEIILFSKRAVPATTGLQTRLLSSDELQAIASSVTSLITDVYDWEGYMVWTRQRLISEPGSLRTAGAGGAYDR
jgi:hypothetical protein